MQDLPFLLQRLLWEMMDPQRTFLLIIKARVYIAVKLHIILKLWSLCWHKCAMFFFHLGADDSQCYLHNQSDRYHSRRCATSWSLILWIMSLSNCLLTKSFISIRSSGDCRFAWWSTHSPDLFPPCCFSVPFGSLFPSCWFMSSVNVFDIGCHSSRTWLYVCAYMIVHSHL